MRRGTTISALLALLLAAVLRLPGLGNGLPEGADPDSLFVLQAQRFEQASAADDEGEVRISNLYPFFLGRLLEALPGTLEPRAPQGAPLAEHLRAAAHPHRLARTLVALLSLLAVPGVVLLARRHLPVGWSLVAGVLAATSLLANVLAHQARPHAPLLSFMVWSLVAAQALARSPTPARIVTCALATGLAVAVLHSGAAVLPAVAVAALVAFRRGGARVLPWMLAFPAVLAAVAWFSYPFLLGGELWAGRPWPEDTLNGAGFARTARTLWVYDPTLCVLAAVAAGAALLGRRVVPRAPDERWDAALLAAFALPYLAAIGMYYSSWHRFALPLVPVLAILAAAGARALSRAASARLHDPRARRAAAAAVGFLAVLFPTATAARLSWLYTLEPTTVRAARWLEANLDPERDVVGLSYGLSLPLSQSIGSVKRTLGIWRTPWQRYLKPFARPVALPAWDLESLWVREELRQDRTIILPEEAVGRLRGSGVSHAVVLVPSRGERRRADSTRAAAVSLGATKLAEFVPYRSEAMEGSVGGLDQLDWEPLSVVWGARYLGPVLEVYALPARVGAKPDRGEGGGDDGK